jgi:hypothetical protein
MRLTLSAASVIPPVYSNVQADARAAFNKAATGSVLQKGYEQIGSQFAKSNKPTQRPLEVKLWRLLLNKIVSKRFSLVQH